jgi:ketosteroid isomerase-like protein
MRALSEHRWLLCTVGRLSLLLVLSTGFIPQAHAGFPHRDSAHKEIEALEMDWRNAQLTNNVTAVDRLLADDYLGISANGTLETKADELGRRRTGSLHITQLELSDIKVRIYGDTAVVTSKADLVGKNGDRDISGRYRYTRVYSNREGQWKIVSFEASRISGNPEPPEPEEKH